MSWYAMDQVDLDALEGEEPFTQIDAILDRLFQLEAEVEMPE